MKTPEVRSPAGPPQSGRLPMLRQDLSIMRGECGADGEAGFLVHDPIANRYFQLDAPTIRLLAVWQPVSPERLMTIAMAKNREAVAPEQVAKTAQFLIENNLVSETANLPGNLAHGNEEKPGQGTGAGSLLSAVFQRIMFLKVPVLNPKCIVNLLWPIVSPLYTRTAAVCLLVMLCIGLFLVSRQWDAFASTLASFMTFEGALVFACALAALKVIHEFGHAFMARKFGVEVPVMGVAFMLLMPVLYTDTSDAWRLRDRSKRLAIDAGGMVAELAVAITATFVWAFMPEGPSRDVAFVFASLSWVTSLMINLNPFMRFDGYYLLSDWLGVPNLQDRGFAFARWHMREALFAIGNEPPEALPRKLRRTLLLHAYGTWVYRLFLYLGISLLIYHFVFKALGLVLAATVLFRFVLMPTWREMQIWWKLKYMIVRTRRSRTSLVALAGFLLLIGLPVFGNVRAPATVEAARAITLFPPSDGRLEVLSAEAGMPVSKGQLLAQLASDELDHRAQLNQLELGLADLRVQRISADSRYRSMRLVLERERLARMEASNALAQERMALQVLAPFNGIVMDMQSGLLPDMYIAQTKPLFTLVDTGSVLVTAMISESGLDRINLGDDAHYLDDDPAVEKVALTVTGIAPVATGNTANTILFDVNGGSIPSTKSADNGPPDPASGPGTGDRNPVGSWYTIRLELPGKERSGEQHEKLRDIFLASSNTPRVRRGMVIIEGERESIAARAFSRIVGVLLRESGF